MQDLFLKGGKKSEKNVKKWISETRVRIEKPSNLSEIAAPTQIQNQKSAHTIFKLKQSNTLFWLSGRAPDSGQSKREFQCLRPCSFAFFIQKDYFTTLFLTYKKSRQEQNVLFLVVFFVRYNGRALV